MKCPKCHKNMKVRSYKNTYYWECFACSKNIGKPVEAIKEDEAKKSEVVEDGETEEV